MGRIVVYGLSFNYWTDPIRNRIDNLNSYLLHQNLNHMDNHKRSLGTSIIYKRCMQLRKEKFHQLPYKPSKLILFLFFFYETSSSFYIYIYIVKRQGNYDD